MEHYEVILDHFEIVLVNSSVYEMAVAALYEQHCYEINKVPPKFVFRSTKDMENPNKFNFHPNEIKAMTKLVHVAPIAQIDSPTRVTESALKIHDICIDNGNWGLGEYSDHVQLEFNVESSCFIELLYEKQVDGTYEFSENYQKVVDVEARLDPFLAYVKQARQLYKETALLLTRPFLKEEYRTHLEFKLEQIQMNVNNWAQLLSNEIHELRQGNHLLKTSADVMLSHSTSIYRQAVQNVVDRQRELRNQNPLPQSILEP